MFGGNSKICRICETSEFRLMTIERRKLFLISLLYPISQYVTPIFEKIAKCELVQEAHLEFWEKAYNRTRQSSGIHDLRTCTCRFCSQDRETMR